MIIKVVSLILYLFIVSLVIKFTPANQALLHDAGAYYQMALSGIRDNFIDPGYPTVLSFLIKVLGPDNLIALQVSNYIFWSISAYLIYLSLKKMNSKSAKFAGILMLFSPLFLTFSAKLYSEPFAALGVSLLIFGAVTYSWLGLMLGSIILGSTKSIFIPGLILLALYYIVKHEFKKFVPLLLGVIVLAPVFLNSLGGGRSLYNLAVERAKLEQSYDQILACAPYYLSYPLGQKLLPQYQGVCHQNDPVPTMPGYESNPYIRAIEIRENGFTYRDWLLSIVRYPVKYLLVFIIGLFNLVLFEGVYPSILLQLPGWVMPLVFIITKICLVSFLWYKVVIASRKNWLYLIPILYLVLMIGNFQVEPRYIYPLIPYIYFLVGI